MSGSTPMSGNTGGRIVGGPGIGVYPDVTELAQRKKYTLSGTVVNAVTGEGLPHAMVSVNNGVITMTDSSGNFAFDGLAAGSYYVFARKPGYFESREASMGRFVKAVDLSSDSTVTLRLNPEAVISGTVTDSDGLPVQRLPVRCLKLAVQDGRKQWMPSGSDTTDEDGYYRMSGLREGTYIVIAGPSQMPAIGAMAKTGQQLAGYSAAYYPGRDDSGSGTGITISPGQKLTVDLSVDAEPFYTVAGSLSGAPQNGGWARLVPQGAGNQEGMGASMRRDNGTFMFRMVPAGNYTLEARASADGTTWSANTPVHVAGDVSGLHVVMSPTVSIPVSVQIRRSKPATEMVSGPTRFRPALPVSVMLRDTEQQDQQVFMASYQRANDSSSYAIRNLEPGTYTAELHATGGLYVASASYGSTDLLRDKIVVSQSASQYPIDIVLRDDGGSVDGTIASDSRPTGGFVVVLPDSGAPFVDYRAGQTGDFSLRELRPGSYSLLAFDSVTDLEYRSRDALEPYMSRAAHVEVTANQQTSVKLELIHRGGDEGED